MLEVSNYINECSWKHYEKIDKFNVSSANSTVTLAFMHWKQTWYCILICMVFLYNLICVKTTVQDINN